MSSRSTFLMAAATAFALALAVSTESLASQNDLEKAQKQNDKIGKLHCFCTDPNSVPGGVGTLGQNSGDVATASPAHIYLGLVCLVPVFDDSGTWGANFGCPQFQILPK
jgi:hypothetical protein